MSDFFSGMVLTAATPEARVQAFIADFATKAEAQSFAISDARANGCRYDHKVSTCILKGV
jgi:hypothetical protein